MNSRKTIRIAALAALAAFGAAGCVSKGKYDEAVARTATTQAELGRKGSALAQTSAELLQRQEEIAELRAELAAVSSSRSLSSARIAYLQKYLVALEAAQEAAEDRAALYRDLSFRLKRQIDDGDLSIVIRDGRMVLQLPNDVLFRTGHTELEPAGKKALEAIAEVIKNLPHRQFQVAGHTDNVPIHNAQFASNWELSTGRALRVVHFLIEKGVDAPTLSAAGYAEIDPVEKNETTDGRRQNRRTEITLQPNIDELVKVPQ